MSLKNITSNTMFISQNEYEKELVAGSGQLKHTFTNDNNKITLPNGKQFVKSVQPVFPAEFTAWISGFFTQ